MIISLITTYKEIQKANNSIYVSKSSQPFVDLKVNTEYGHINNNTKYCFTYNIHATNKNISPKRFIFVELRNWQRDLHCLSAWMRWRIVKRLLHYIELVYYLLYKIISTLLMIHPHHRHAYSFWTFWMNSPISSSNKTRKSCKFLYSKAQSSPPTQVPSIHFVCLWSFL